VQFCQTFSDVNAALAPWTGHLDKPEKRIPVGVLKPRHFSAAYLDARSNPLSDKGNFLAAFAGSAGSLCKMD